MKNETIELAKSGDIAARNEIATKYSRIVRAFILKNFKNVACTGFLDDVVQDTMLKVFRFLCGYDPRVGVKFDTWVLAICKNSCCDFLRLRKYRGFIPIDDFTHFIEIEQAPEYDKIMKSVEEIVKTEMPKSFRESFSMRVFEDMEYSAIAEELEIPLGTVKSRIVRARRYLEPYRSEIF